MGKKKFSAMKRKNSFLSNDEESKYSVALSKRPKFGAGILESSGLTPNQRKKLKKKKKQNSLLQNESHMQCKTENMNGTNHVNGFRNHSPKILVPNGVHSNGLKMLNEMQNKKINGVKSKNIHFINGREKFKKSFSNKKININQNALPANAPLSREKILDQRQSLPIYSSRNEVISQLAKCQTAIVIGETGSGKTTQIPQFLHERGLDEGGAICITQPRRVAAITIAKRVAEEMNCDIGDIVGYSVRFEESYSNRTKLKYVTDGMLLREALSDPLLSKYRWIILDEAHERSINTDILFGIVKAAQRKRKLKQKLPLRIIIMSATMDVDHFSSYFNDAPVLYIEGRQHPVEVFASKHKNPDYTVACLSTMLKIHKEANSEEDILIFLTGQEEIDSAVKLISHIAKDPKLSNYPKLKVFPLYAALPHHKQLKVFARSLPGERKVIVSTNIAETSITIPGIKYVIDCGHAKVRTFNSISGFDDLKVCKISQSQAWQRTGRAGREAPGICYRAYTNEEFLMMKVNMVPEILRANLASVLLKLLAIGIKDVVKFDFIDKPSNENLKQSLNNLKDLKAVEIVEGIPVLTDLGRKMAIFPLEPQYAKLLINGAIYSCTEEVLTIIAILSSESIYVNPSDKRRDATEKRAKFSALDGDHLTLLNVYKAFTESPNKKAWCKKNFLNFRNLSYASEVRRQLRELCLKNKVPLTTCNEKPEPILRCLISALYKNIAELNFRGKFRLLHSSEFARIHPSSTVFGRTPDYLLFTELVKTGRTFMHINSEVRAEWLVEFDAEYFRSKHIRKLAS